MDISKEILDGLSEDMRQKVSACTSAADLLALVKSEGVKLTPEQMEMVSGGNFWDGKNDGTDYELPECGSVYMF